MSNFFFPEEFNPPVSNDYGKICSVGLQNASKIDAMFIGAVRDAEPYLERNLMCLDHMRSFFNSSSVFLFENDSKDSTKKIVEKPKTTKKTYSRKPKTTENKEANLWKI